MKPITNIKHVALRRRDSFTIDPKLIEDSEGLNEREDYGADFPELKESIRKDGVAEDLEVSVEAGHIRLIKGYRRMRAVRELIAEKLWTHEGVPCKSERRSGDARQVLVGRLIEQISHNLGKPYTILEQGRVYTRLLEQGVTEKEIQERTGKSRPAVKNAVLLAEADPAVLKQIAGGHISESLVVEFIREAKGDAAKVVTLVEESVGTAAASGKKKASRKHAPKNSKTAGKKKKAAAQEPSGSTPAQWSGGASGGDRTSMDSTTNLKKLNDLMEDLERDKCDPKCYDTIEAVIDFMEGKKTVREMKDYIRA